MARNFRSDFILNDLNGMQKFFTLVRENWKEHIANPAIPFDWPIEIQTVGTDLKEVTDPLGNVDDVTVPVPAVYFGIGGFQRSSGTTSSDAERERTLIDIYAIVNEFIHENDPDQNKTLVERVGDMISLVEMFVKQARAFMPDGVYIEDVNISNFQVERGNPSKYREMIFEIEYIYQYRLP